MNFPPPSDRQARILWLSLTTLAIGVIIALAGALAFGIGLIIKQLSSVLLPLAVAGILAFLLDPVVDFFQRRHLSRKWSIILVFALAISVVALFLALVIPRVVADVGELAEKAPKIRDTLTQRIDQTYDWLKVKLNRPEMQNPVEKIKQLLNENGKDWGLKAAAQIDEVSKWLFQNIVKAASFVGLLVGFALVPVYLFYFLLEKRGITGRWTDYLPIQEPAIKRELVFFIKSVNDSLIVFFRGQVLVAICVGTLTAIGYTVIGLNYGLLLGVMVGVLGIIPYLGVMMSFIPAVIIGIVQFGDWRVGLVVVVFLTVQTLEGMVISPRIIGERVGMHPLTVIVAVMIGGTLLGGIVGGILAIPITAVLRALMFRYVWVKRDPSTIQGDETVATEG